VCDFPANGRLADPEDPRNPKRTLKNHTTVNNPYVVRHNWYLSLEGTQVLHQLMALVDDKEAAPMPVQIVANRYPPPPPAYNSVVDQPPMHAFIL
jgi:hypothetical protein